MGFFLKYAHDDTLLSSHFGAPSIIDHEDLMKKN
jgi:hypothetical protein